MEKVSDLKMLLMEILESAFQKEDITATQQMGVSVSNSMKREGMVIIQNQNVEVYARIMPSMIKALKLCDIIESNSRNQIEIQVNPLQIEAPSTRDPVEACCAWFYDNEISWEDMQDTMRKRYLEHVVGKFRTKAEAARLLDVNTTYLCRLLRSGKHQQANQGLE